MGRGITYPRNKEIDQRRWCTELFWSKVDQSQGDDQCWPWLGSQSKTGGLFGIRMVREDGTDYPQMTQARRVMYAETQGSWLPDRLGIYHSCGNNLCMNPSHFSEQRRVFNPGGKKI